MCVCCVDLPVSCVPKFLSPFSGLRCAYSLFYIRYYLACFPFSATLSLWSWTYRFVAKLSIALCIFSCVFNLSQKKKFFCLIFLSKKKEKNVFVLLFIDVYNFCVEVEITLNWTFWWLYRLYGFRMKFRTKKWKFDDKFQRTSISYECSRYTKATVVCCAMRFDSNAKAKTAVNTDV